MSFVRYYLSMIAAIFMLSAPSGIAYAQAGQAQVPAVITETPAPAMPSPPPASADDVEGYVLGPGDSIDVAVLGREEYQARVQIQVDGSVQLPYLRNVPAANKTVVELREDIAQRLKTGGFYTDPIVSVSVVNYAARYVVVLGEFASPGLVPIDRAYRVSEIIARVGGVRASGADVLKLRRETGEEMELNIRDVATGGDDADPFVKPGDKLYVDQAKQFYIYGQVAAPGTYKVEKSMTLRMALARSGGLTSLGSEKRLKIFRAGQEMKTRDLSDLVLPDDVIVIGERFF